MKKKLDILKDLTDLELQDKLQSEREALGKLRFNHAVSPVESPAQLRSKRIQDGLRQGRNQILPFQQELRRHRRGCRNLC